MRRARRRLGQETQGLPADRLDNKGILNDSHRRGREPYGEPARMKIEQRRSDIRKHTDYVRGKRGTLKFASDEFKRYMSDRFSGFADNWCLPVAQAPVERIHFRGFIPYGDVELDSHVMRVWERNDCDRKLQETA